MKRLILYTVGGLCLAMGVLPVNDALAEPFAGQVLEIVSGDLLKVSHDGQTGVFRIAGVDCPELEQPFGPEAKAFTKSLIQDSEVQFDALGAGEAATRIATVTLADGTALSHEIVGAGMGWFYEKDTPVDPALRGLAAKAITGKKGLWSDPAPLAPWDFRANPPKSKKTETAAKAETAAKTETAKEDAGEAVFVTKNGREYHKPGCRFLDKSQKMIPRNQAEKLKYTACTVCFPPKAGEGAVKLEAEGDAVSTPEEPAEKPAEKTAEPAPPAPAATSRVAIAGMENNEMFNQVQPTWSRDNSGRVLGITAQNLSATPIGPIAAGLGIQDGDVIQAVNGEAIDSEQKIMALVNKYKDTRQFQVTVLRDGKPQTLNVDLSMLPF